MSQVQQVKDVSDIVEVISERVPLKRSGQNWRGICPFHVEKTPSFFINEQLQRFKCFGCGESGDVLTFLEKYEGMTFAEALQHLADRGGITLKEYQKTAADTKREKLLEILNLAKEYYYYVLTEHAAGKTAREYLKNRGLTQESIKVFQLGYALPSWDGLTKYLNQKKKFDLNDLVAAGVVIRHQSGRYYDRFRDRIMFPLKNHRGQVVGFSGRVLNPDAKEAKYINTPETELYHKAELLFGYSELLQFIRKANEVIVTEGEFDTISSAQAHVNNIVAIKGSAFTEQHAKLIRRVAERVLFALDMDGAGIEATKRAIPIAQAQQLDLRVVILSDAVGEGEDAAKDPDELARTNPAAWRKAAKSSLSVYEFLIQAALHQHDASQPEGKRKIVQELAPIINQIPHAVEKDFYVKELARHLQVTERVLQQDLRLPDRSNRSPRGRATQPPAQIESPVMNKRHRLEAYLWFIFFQLPSAKQQQYWPSLLSLPFAAPVLKTLATKLKKLDKPLLLEDAAKTLPDDLQAGLFDVILIPEHLAIAEHADFGPEWDKTFDELQRLGKQDQITVITQELDELDRIDPKTPAQERRQEELLAQVVVLKSKARAV